MAFSFSEILRCGSKKERLLSGIAIDFAFLQTLNQRSLTPSIAPSKSELIRYRTSGDSSPEPKARVPVCLQSMA
jgi:hypothetical protein